MAYDVLEVCRHIINYSNEKDYGISNLKLQKILYFVQAYFWMTSNGEESCFNEKIEAWDFGPVVPEAYREFKQYGSGDIPTIKSIFICDDEDIWNFTKKPYLDDKISRRDKEKINSVIDLFSEYSATDLVTLTHQQSPWRDTYEKHKNREIKKEKILGYFNG